MKIITLLKTLNVEEKRDLGKFLKGGSLEQLYKNWLLALEKSDDQIVLDAEAVWPLLYGKKQAFKRTKFDQMNSKLAVQVENFLLIDSRDKGLFETELAVLTLYEQRGIIENRYFTQEIAVIQDKLAKQSHKSFELLTQEWLLEVRIERSKSTENVSIPKSDPLQVAIRLDLIYACQKLRLLSHLAMHRRVQLDAQKLSGENELINWLESDEALRNNHILIKGYYTIYKMMSGDDVVQTDAYYETLTQIIKQPFEQIALEEYKHFCNYAINYAATAVNQGKENAHARLFNLYADCFELGVLIENGAIKAAHFTNVIKIGFRSAGAVATIALVEKYQHLLPTATAPYDQYYLQALLAFYTGNYAKTLDFLPPETVYDEQFYPLNRRVLRLKAYVFYEVESDNFANEFRSFTDFLQKNPLKYNQDRVDAYLYTLPFVKIFYRLKNRKGKFYTKTRNEMKIELTDFLKRIEADTDLIDKEWFALEIQKELAS